MDAHAIHDPPAIVWPAKKKRTPSARRKTALFVGAIILLSDGSACHVVAFDANGHPLCLIVPPGH